MSEKDIENKIKELIEDIRPLLNSDGGDIEFIRYEDNFAYVKLGGSCSHCEYIDGTLSYGVEAYLKDAIPELEGVINVGL